MKSRKIVLQTLLALALVFSLMVPAWAAGASVTAHWPDEPSISHMAADNWSNTALMTSNRPQGRVTLMSAADTMVSAGNHNPPPESDVGNWTGIIQVAAGSLYTVGLKLNGTVVAVGEGWEGQFRGWTHIIQVAAGYHHAVGLKSDGTVVAVGWNLWGQCNVTGWSNITQVAAGAGHTVGLRADGTVVAVGKNRDGQCNVTGWSNITQVAAGGVHTVGLRSDGTVVAVGGNEHGQCNVGGWTGIIQVAAGGAHTAGLKSHGTVVATGDNLVGQGSGWTDIIQVAAGRSHTVGLKSDGTVVAVGSNDYGQCNVTGWTNITQVAGGEFHTVGLRSDGTVVAVGGYVVRLLPTPCFIATAVYGTPMAGEIEVLREFRDEYLLTTPLGQALADLYYRVSPPMAEFITEHPSLKPIVRAGLVPAVVISTVVVNTTPAEKAAIIGLVVLVSVALSIRTTRRGARSPVLKM